MHGERVELVEVAGVKGEEEVTEPGVLSVLEAIEDGVEEELAEIVY